MTAPPFRAASCKLLRVRPLLLAAVLLLGLSSVTNGPGGRGGAPEVDPGNAGHPSDQHRQRQSAFLMLPDGTTMMVDAGTGATCPRAARAETRCITTARRVDRAIHAGDGRLLYRLRLSHALSRRSYERDGRCREPNARVRMLDRAWPDYNYPSVDHLEFQSPRSSSIASG